MNKLLLKVLSLIIIISLFTSLFCINVNANESANSTFLNTYAAYYFKNLNSNFGLNTEGSCCYVAIGMLLSYYDSFLNDYFISENYDCTGKITSYFDQISSPGIFQEEDWESNSIYTDYNDFVDENADTYFHLKLLQIGRDDLELYNQAVNNESNFCSPEKTMDPSWGITAYEAKNVLEEYFSQFDNDNAEMNEIKNNVSVMMSSYSDDEHTNLSNPNAAIRDEMIEKIKSGIPVIYRGRPETDGAGHMMIGYDYDEENDEIYFHSGWNSDTIITDKETDIFVYTTNSAIIWLEINENNLSHSHAYNYVDLDTNEQICACQIFSSHSSHSNNHWYVQKYDSQNHFYTCCCGNEINISGHSMIYAPLTSTKHRELCTECDYFKEKADHRYNIFSSYTESEHTVKCACGQLRTEDHYTYSYMIKNENHHSVYCECGSWIEDDVHNMVPSFRPLFSICTECGYERSNLNPGIIIKSEQDEPVTE